MFSLDTYLSHVILAPQCFCGHVPFFFFEFIVLESFFFILLFFFLSPCGVFFLVPSSPTSWAEMVPVGFFASALQVSPPPPFPLPALSLFFFFWWVFSFHLFVVP